MQPFDLICASINLNDRYQLNLQGILAMNYKKRIRMNVFLMGLALVGCMPATIEAANTTSLNPVTQSVHQHVKWLMIAEVDLKAAKKLSESEELVGPALYHIQQCVEKTLKAYLVYKNKPVIKTHDLVELIKACSTMDNDFAQLRLAAAELSPYATLSRYPNSRFCADLSTAHTCMRHALEILTLVKNKLLE